VAAAVALADVEERRLGTRIGAEIREGGGFHADQRGHSSRSEGFGSVRVGASDATLTGSPPYRALRRGEGDLPLYQAFAGRREPIIELRRGEAVDEVVAGRSWVFAASRPALGALPH